MFLKPLRAGVEVLDIFFCYKIGSTTFCLNFFFFLLHREFLFFETADLVVLSPKSPLTEKIPPSKPFSLTCLATETYFKKQGERHYRKQNAAADPGSKNPGCLNCLLAAGAQMLLAVSCVSS